MRPQSKNDLMQRITHRSRFNKKALLCVANEPKWPILIASAFQWPNVLLYQFLSAMRHMYDKLIEVSGGCGGGSNDSWSLCRSYITCKYHCKERKMCVCKRVSHEICQMFIQFVYVMYFIAFLATIVKYDLFYLYSVHK